MTIPKRNAEIIPSMGDTTMKIMTANRPDIRIAPVKIRIGTVNAMPARKEIGMYFVPSSLCILAAMIIIPAVTKPPMITETMRTITDCMSGKIIAPRPPTAKPAPTRPPTRA